MLMAGMLQFFIEYSCQTPDHTRVPLKKLLFQQMLLVTLCTAGIVCQIVNSVTCSEQKYTDSMHNVTGPIKKVHNYFIQIV